MVFEEQSHLRLLASTIKLQPQIIQLFTDLLFKMFALLPHQSRVTRESGLKSAPMKSDNDSRPSDIHLQFRHVTCLSVTFHILRKNADCKRGLQATPGCHTLKCRCAVIPPSTQNSQSIRFSAKSTEAAGTFLHDSCRTDTRLEACLMAQITVAAQ